MRILLIRHGESVDNVAGLYAGSRDSPLTNHGVLQIKRLGAHLAKRHETIGLVKYIFTSNLQRAYQTADAVAEALADARSSFSEPSLGTRTRLEVVRLPELREKDYGSSEGKKYTVKASGAVALSDSESHDSMRTRVNRFLDSHLNPITDTHASDNISVVIVAHGIILGVLLKALLENFPHNPILLRSQGGSHEIQPEYIAWSNTGVLQVRLAPNKDVSRPENLSQTVPSASLSSGNHADSSPVSHRRALGLTVEFTNNTDHLQGLKKTRGGIGSARFDSRQRTMDSFFTPTSKKRKIEDVRDP